MDIRSINTRFRAYQLGSAGCSFSVFAGSWFTLIEARLNDTNRASIYAELKLCGKEYIDVLHITSWDIDHCAAAELNEILLRFKPKKIEYPGYLPESDNGKDCLQLIRRYESMVDSINREVKCIAITSDYINNLPQAQRFGYNDVLFHPTHDFPDSNNNSTVKLFRLGCFNVLSLGDIEDESLAMMLCRQIIVTSEVDVLLLAHHGADCATNSKQLLQQISPRVAICGSDYDNKFEHPRPEVRERLYELKIKLLTTKTGDVIIHSLPPHDGIFIANNFIANTTEISSSYQYTAKKRISLLNLARNSTLASQVITANGRELP